MNAQLFENAFTTSKTLTSDPTDFELILSQKKSALSSMDFLEDEAERFEEEEEDKEIVATKIKRFNSNCFLVSCRSETSEDFSLNDSTNYI
jgi:hypothetical protein